MQVKEKFAVGPDAQATSTADLWEVLQKALEEITAECLQKRISRMPQICQTVIPAKDCLFDEHENYSVCKYKNKFSPFFLTRF